MRRVILRSLVVLFAALATKVSPAEPALTILGKDFTFPNKINGLPAKLSDFTRPGNWFSTSAWLRLSLTSPIASSRGSIIVPSTRSAMKSNGSSARLKGSFASSLASISSTSSSLAFLQFALIVEPHRLV